MTSASRDALEALRKVERLVLSRKATKEQIDRALEAVEALGDEVVSQLARHMVGEQRHPPGSAK